MRHGTRCRACKHVRRAKRRPAARGRLPSASRLSTSACVWQKCSILEETNPHTSISTGSCVPSPAIAVRGTTGAVRPTPRGALALAERCPAPWRRRRAAVSLLPRRSSAPESLPQERADPHPRRKHGEPHPHACRPGQRLRSERLLRQESARVPHPPASGRRVQLRLPPPLLPPSILPSSAAKRRSPSRRRAAAGQ